MVNNYHFNYRLNDFFEKEDPKKPTKKLLKAGHKILTQYEETGERPVGLYLVGGLAREDTSVKGRKDADFLLVPNRLTHPIEESRLYMLLTAPIREVLGEHYDVFVGQLELQKDGTARPHVDITNHFF